MKIFIFALMTFVAFSSYAQDSESLASVDFFRFFTGSYHVAKRTCRADDSICASVDSLKVDFKEGEPIQISEYSNGKLLDRTVLTVYGDVSSGQSYGMVYGTPSEIAGWTETIKNSDKEVTEENTAGIQQKANPDENGPVFIYSFGKGHKTYDPATGKTLSRSLRNYQLVRDNEQ
jgi:hypothetical protein